MNLAIVFPGQGSQSIGMLDGLAAKFPEIKETFAQASKIVKRDLWKITHTGPQPQLDLTINTQPIMLAAGVAIWRIWQDNGGCDPMLMAGHSLGEYSALVCAGAIGFQDAVGLVQERAQLMQEAVPAGEGAMSAILGLEDQQVIDVCRRSSSEGVVEAVNFNSPGQVVIAGAASAVRKATVMASELGAKRAIELPVSVPSHSSLMKTAAQKLSRKLATIRFSPATTPVVHNLDARIHPDAPGMRAMLTQQLHSPVLWSQTVQYLAEQGVTTVMEFGPGKVLTGINKRVEKTLQVFCVQDPLSLEQALKRCEDAA
jgi:[acyl-carrier-protein] S-malonyltransferase